MGGPIQERAENSGLVEQLSLTLVLLPVPGDNWTMDRPCWVDTSSSRGLVGRITAGRPTSLQRTISEGEEVSFVAGKPCLLTVMDTRVLAASFLLGPDKLLRVKLLPDRVASFVLEKQPSADPPATPGQAAS